MTKQRMINEQIPGKQRLTIRVGKSTLSFAMSDMGGNGQPIAYEPYVIKSGISMAANLRSAFKTVELLSGSPVRVFVMIDTPALMVPVEQFEEPEAEPLYQATLIQDQPLSITYNVLPDLNAVAVFGINKDLRLVITDHFPQARFIHVMEPVWRHLYRRSFTGHHEKLYAYFHDGQADIFAFQQSRFRFCNAYETAHARDAVYFLLNVWKTLQLDAEADELHLVGDIPDREWLVEELHRYLHKAYVINPVAEFNRAPATQLKDIPFDFMTLLIKGR